MSRYGPRKEKRDRRRNPDPDLAIPPMEPSQKPMVPNNSRHARDMLLSNASPGRPARTQDKYRTEPDDSRHLLHQRPGYTDPGPRGQHSTLALPRLHPAHGLLLHVPHDARDRAGDRQQQSAIGPSAAERLGGTGLPANCVSEEEMQFKQTPLESSPLNLNANRLSVNTLMTRKADGNATLTLTKSVMGNAIGPFLSSLLVIGYTSLPVWYTKAMPMAVGGLGALLQRVFVQFGLTLILPLGFGQLVQSYFPDLVRMLLHDYQLIKLGSISLLVLIWSGYDSAVASHAFADVEKVQIIGVIGICLLVFLLWMLVTMATSVVFLGRGDAVAAAFCISTKSPALGIPLVTILFAGMPAEDTAKVYIPLIIFQFIQTCLSNLATLPLRHWRTEAKCQKDSKDMSDSESLA
ncbi:sodium bile acid symporter family protein [Apiospora marii]|uniref:Sodium bile acid symporter family protein n=1 Tax=Apiospora marii TaxID=335849 RepID=A0ABR1RE09_9PEZI